MQKEHLEQEILLSNSLYDKAKKNKEKLENDQKVVKYLQEIESMKEEKERIQFLSQMVIGEDGTVFSPYERYQVKAFSETHYGLTDILRYAFHLKQQQMKEEIKSGIIQFYITYQELEDYIRNVNRKLRRFYYIEGDRKFVNTYGYEIYQNPRNYSVVEPQVIWMEGKNQSYNINMYGVKANEEQRYFYFSGVEQKLAISSELTPREYEAFYGEGAKKALGIKKEKGKVYYK